MFSQNARTGHSQGICPLVLFSLAFWLWLAKDIVGHLLARHGLASGSYLLIITVLVFGTTFLARLLANPPSRCDQPVATSHRLLKWSVMSIIVIGISMQVSGATAFSLFKLTNYVINLGVAFVLAYHIVSYRVHTARSFIITGVLVSLLGYSVLGDLALANENIGLRALSIAHLDVQDFYALLWLFSFAGVCLAPTSVSRAAVFVLASSICLPVMILMNSRMIPFTIGATLFVIVVGSRKAAVAGRGLVRAILVAVAIAGLAHEISSYTSANPNSRLAILHSDGIVSAFRRDPRYDSFREALCNYLDAPLLGIGFGRFTNRGMRLNLNDRLAGTWPHNIFLELASEMGTVGLVVFGVPLLICLREMLKRVRKGNLEHIMYPSICFVYPFATMQLSHNLWHAKLWIGLMWTIMAMATTQDRERVAHRSVNGHVVDMERTVYTHRPRRGSQDHVHMRQA